MSWYDLDLTFDFVIVTKTFKFLSRLFLVKLTCRKLILGMDIGCKV